MNKIWIVALALLTFFSCGRNYYSLKPITENVIWQQGKPFYHQKRNGIDVFVCYEDRTNDRFVFYVEIKNEKKEEVVVDPRDFYGLYDETIIINQEVKKLKRRVMDPEDQLYVLEKKKSETNDMYLVMSAGNCCCMLGGSAYQSKEDEDGDDDGIDGGDVVVGHMELQRDLGEAKDEEMYDIEMEKIYWKEEALRKTTLFQNDMINGEISIPLAEKSTILNLFIIIQNTEFRFPFSIEKKQI